MLKPIDAATFGEFCVATARLRALWPLNEAAPAGFIGEWRRLAEQFGLLGAKSRVLARKRQAEANPFTHNGRRPPSDPVR
jgi:hypothetical protein